jgi:hypothetical protein
MGFVSLVAVFDRLVEMIPANVYVAKENPTDQWVSWAQQTVVREGRLGCAL